MTDEIKIDTDETGGVPLADEHEPDYVTITSERRIREMTDSGDAPLADESDAAGERYAIDVEPERVHVIDTWRAPAESYLRTFAGPERLANALAYVAKIGETSGALRRQRLEGMLAEVRAAEDQSLAALLADLRTLNQAVDLRERLEKELADGLSATESVENVSGHPRGSSGVLATSRGSAWTDVEQARSVLICPI
jgi:hypothetical protein